MNKLNELKQYFETVQDNTYNMNTYEVLNNILEELDCLIKEEETLK